MAGWKAETLVRQWPHRWWHIPICRRTPGDENQRPWHLSVVWRILTIHHCTCRWNHREHRRKNFGNDWFNKEQNLNITKSDLIELLRIATKNQLFQFEGNLYEQVDGVAMGSPLGPLMANSFMCNIEKQLETENKMPAFYKRYVDDTLSTMSNSETASEFLTTLNNSQPSIDFTMELEENGRLPFLGMDIIRNGSRLDTKVYRKPTDTGLLLHYHSHVDGRYKRSLLNTMRNRAFKLSSTWKLFHQECERLKETFSRLRYPDKLVQSTIRQLVWIQKCLRIHAPNRKYLRSKKPQSESCCLSKIRICKRSAQTTWWPQPGDQCGYQPGVHKSKDQGWNQSEGRQATPCESTMRCVSLSVWPVWCRLCRLYVLTPLPANWRAQGIGNRKPPEGTTQYSPKWHCAKF